MVVLVGFAAVGRRSHGESGALARRRWRWRGPSSSRGSRWAGASGALIQIAPVPAAISWMAAWPLALILRAISGRGDAPSFAIVALVVPLSSA